MNEPVTPDLARCGYPTKSGSPCRIQVASPGLPCRMHQKQALLDRLLGRSPGPVPPTEDRPEAAPDEKTESQTVDARADPDPT